MKDFDVKPYFNLQLFAEGEGVGAGDEGSNGAGAGDNSGNGSNGGEANKREPMSFDDFLKLQGNQAEFDRRVQKAVTTAVTNAKEKWEALTNDKLTEAEKLAKMSEDEKSKYKIAQLEKKIDEMNREKSVNELSKTARKMLSDEGINIPDELLSHLVSDNADDTKATVEAFAKLYKDAVQAGVKDAVHGGTPKGGSGNKRTTITKEQIKQIEDPVERQRLMVENYQLYQNN